MKKIISYVFAVLSIGLTACSSEIDDSTSVQNNEIVVQGKQFANIHNECLAYIYSSLINKKTRISDNRCFSKSDIIDAVNKCIASHVSTTRTKSDTEYITEETFEKSINDIRNQMTEIELSYIERVLVNEENTSRIFDEIINNKSMNDESKKAVVCFIATYEASSEYWQQNIDEWKNNIAGTPTTRSVKFNWKEVATADAYWGYTGMLSSGLNLWVGGGAAAVGSAFACLK